MSNPSMTSLSAEVWGSPVGHSKSPDLHLACYHHLGIAGHYERREVTGDTLADVFAQHRSTLTGISLTMPLKTGIVGLVPDHRGDVTLLGAANTAVKTGEQWWLTNTDPLGAAAMIRRLLPDTAAPVVVLGAGATAKSVVLGLHHAGFRGSLALVVRSTTRASETAALAHSLGIPTKVVGFDQVDGAGEASLVVSTVPSGTPLPDTIVSALQLGGAALMDVGYHPWPTPLATAWIDRGLDAHSGLPMLMFQALGQIRAFVNGDTSLPLPDEAGALSAMAQAVSIDPVWATPTLMGQ